MKVDKWFPTKDRTHTGWEKSMPMDKRRRLVLKAHGRDYLASARGLQALANVTKDSETKQKAKADAKYFYNEYAKRK